MTKPDYQEFEILDKKELTFDSFLFSLKGRLDFKPGQFVRAKVGHIGEAVFAPCSDPKNKEKIELCVKAVGNVSNAISKLLPGDFLDIRGPYGNGWPTKTILTRDIVLIAGGMGIVPIRSLLFGLEKKKFRLGNIRILAGFKTSDQILFEEDLRRYVKKYRARIYAEYADHHFWGEKGLITGGIEKLKISPEKTMVFMCGPEIMYKYCIEALKRKGISENQIYTSYERRMECGIGLCQHCSIGKYLVCQDGPVFRFDKIKEELNK